MKIAVILSGCGKMDGSEVHEATLTLWAIHKNGADYQCFAPDMQQHHVINHVTGQEMEGTRNVLIESARIARGEIDDLEKFSASEVDALILPGGFGAAKNLSTFAFDGAACKVNEQVEKAVREMHLAGKPIGALCIAPVIITRILKDVTVTIGQDPATAASITEMGANHTDSWQAEVVVDEANKIVTTPCYMLDSRVDQIGEGIDRLVKALMALT